MIDQIKFALLLYAFQSAAIDHLVIVTSEAACPYLPRRFKWLKVIGEVRVKVTTQGIYVDMGDRNSMSDQKNPYEM